MSKFLICPACLGDVDFITGSLFLCNECGSRLDIAHVESFNKGYNKAFNDLIKYKDISIKLEQQNKIMKEALEIYATKGQYCEELTGFYYSPDGETFYHEGEYAQEALAKVNKLDEVK